MARASRRAKTAPSAKGKPVAKGAKRVRKRAKTSVAVKDLPPKTAVKEAVVRRIVNKRVLA